MNIGIHESVLILSNVHLNRSLLNLQELSQGSHIVHHIGGLSLHLRKCTVYSTFDTSSTYLDILFSYFVYRSCRCIAEGVGIPCVPANVSQGGQRKKRERIRLKKCGARYNYKMYSVRSSDVWRQITVGHKIISCTVFFSLSSLANRWDNLYSGLTVVLQGLHLLLKILLFYCS